MQLCILTPAKVNLTLIVRGRRADGYHLLDSIFVPVSLWDRLEVVSFRSLPPEKVGRAIVELHTNRDVGVGEADNLVHRAARSFAAASRRSFELRLRLVKRIPIGGGLGGGSSDAAAILAFLAGAFPGAVSRLDLVRLALSLGADVPFFLTGGACRVRGIGDAIEPIEMPLPSALVLCSDGTSLATSAVFSAYDRALTSASYPSMKHRPASGDEGFACSVENDLERAANSIHPGIAAMRDTLLSEGALGASMTGSGSTVFGIASDGRTARRMAERVRRRGYWAKAVRVVRQRSALFGRFRT